MPLSKAAEGRTEYLRLKCEGDPIKVAVMRAAYSEKVDKVLELSLIWTSEFIDAEAEYKREVCKIQLELEKEGKASTAAESTAKARCAESKISLAEFRYVKNYYEKLWQTYHRRSPYG